MYVIQNTRNGTYLDEKLQWRKDIANAQFFKTAGGAQNHIQHAYKPWLRKHPMAPGEKELKVVPLRDAEEPAPLAESSAESFTMGLASRIDAQRLKTQFEDLVEVYGSLLKYAEDEKRDILHKIELEQKLSAPERASLFKRLREVLIYRRQCKDMCEYLEKYRKTGFLEACARLEEANCAFAEHLQNRTYRPKILMELFEKEAAS